MIPAPGGRTSSVLKLLAALLAVGGVVWLARRPRERLRALAVAGVLERPTRHRSYAELSRELDKAGTRLDARLAQAADTESNREWARHIIGIERWGQSRLQVLNLGKLSGGEGVSGGHRPYRPDAELSLPQLRELASLTRAQTSQLARQFEQTPPHEKAEHNSLGPLSARAWLRYLNLHADLESRRLK